MKKLAITLAILILLQFCVRTEQEHIVSSLPDKVIGVLSSTSSKIIDDQLVLSRINENTQTFLSKNFKYKDSFQILNKKIVVAEDGSLFLSVDVSTEKLGDVSLFTKLSKMSHKSINDNNQTYLMMLSITVSCGGCKDCKVRYYPLDGGYYECNRSCCQMTVSE
jgi:hypothetical protein